MDAIKDALDAQTLLEAQTYQRAACDMLRQAARKLSSYGRIHVLGTVRATLLGHVQALQAADEIMRELWLDWRAKHGKG